MIVQNASHPSPTPRNIQAHVAASAETSGALDTMGIPMTFKRNSEIYGEGEPSDYLYKVTTGAVRTYRILADGRRQIGAFYLPGDIFGLENGKIHVFSAEAITDSKIIAIKRSTIVTLAARDSAIARELWNVTTCELERVQQHLVALIKSAEERVAGFLLEMARRTSGTNQVQLPMSRQDIADYLGLTIETVSRTMTHLESTAAIALPSSRCVVLRNKVTLGRLNS
jgi:CRP-like cAMP-binding protein